MKQLIGADPIVLVRHIYLLVNNIRRECMLCVMYVMLDFNLVIVIVLNLTDSIV